MTVMLSADAVARDWIASWIEGDFDRMATHLAPDVAYRELTPSGIDSHKSAADLLATCKGVYESTDAVELLFVQAEPCGPRTRLSFGAKVRMDGRTVQFEEHGYLDVVDGRITAMDFVCSGFH